MKQKQSHRHREQICGCQRGGWWGRNGLKVWHSVQFSSVQSLSHVQLFATPWTAARQGTLSITNSQSLLRLMSTESVMPLNHLILCHPLLLLPSIFPALGSFQMSQFFTSGGQSIGVSASASILPMNIQDWFPLERTGWISLRSKGLSRVFSSTWATRECCVTLMSPLNSFAKNNHTLP